MSSNKCGLRLNLTFLPKEEGGKSAAATTDQYRPRIKVEDYFSSCVVESTSGAVETLVLQKPHEVTVWLMWERIEEYSGKSIEVLFPVGSTAEIFEVDLSRPVARGVVLAVQRA